MSDTLGPMRANMRAYARLGYRDICALEMWEHHRN